MSMKADLMKKVQDRSLRIGVVGLGYVGLPLAVEKAKAGFKTIGFDVQESKVDFYAVVTNLQTGKAEYKLLDTLDNYDQVEYLRASGSMPFVSHIIQVNGHEYLDGGCSDSIPIKKMLEMDVDKIIVVLTRPLDYRKKPSNKHLNKLFYHQYPHFVETLNNRYLNYNASLDLITKLEKEKKIFVLRPSQLIPIGRLEKDKEVIQQMYDLGVSDCNNQLENLKKYLRG